MSMGNAKRYLRGWRSLPYGRGSVKQAVYWALASIFAGAAGQAGAPGRLVFAETGPLNAVSPVGWRSLPTQIAAADYSPDYARRVLVPAMGGSIAVGDFDGDGHPDFYAAVPGGANSLFRGSGGGTFRDATAKAKVSGPGGSLSATFCDYDRSGRPSLFVAGAAGVVLYRNHGDGTFSDVTDKAGLTAPAGVLYTRAVLADLDGDGFPDLLVTAYTDLNRPPAKAAFTFPDDFSGTDSRLYRNNGYGGFTDVTAAAGLAGNPGRARSAVIADFNHDGRPDLLILRDDKPPAFYRNRGGFRFEDATWDAGEALTRHAFFDATAVDLNGDGNLDLVLWSTMSFRVLLNRGNAVFERAESVPLLPPMPSPFGFHGAVADLDGNGFDDVVSLDNEGRWHAFVNQAGSFREMPFEGGPAGLAFLVPLPKGGPLLALHWDGRITTLQRVSNPGAAVTGLASPAPRPPL
jgi:hypothetical protein